MQLRAEFIVVFALFAGSPDRLEARFLDDDAREIDREERNNTETYNDKLSYRYPVAWDRLWHQRDIGLRINAGSLNMSRFDYQDDMKFRSARGKRAAFAFNQTRREDFIEVREEREVRVGYQFVSPVTAWLMADGGTFKEYGDLGVALTLFDERDRYVEVFHWSVDHYYETKKTDADDRRKERAASYGGAFRWQFGRATIGGRYERDVPFTWIRESLGFTYDYERRAASTRISQALNDAWELAVQSDQEWKREEKVSGDRKKSLVRHVSINEISATQTQDDVVINAGGVHVYRHLRYEHEDSPESESPPFVRRKEPAIYITRYAPLAVPDHYWQAGLHANHVAIDEGDRRFREQEIKLQLAWEFRYDDSVRAFVNTTWDLDQLYRDYPYDDRGFRPWGGGNVQFVAAF